jgi:hypothetical protein
MLSLMRSSALLGLHVCMYTLIHTAHTHTHTLSLFHNKCYLICAQLVKPCALNVRTAELDSARFERPHEVLRAKATLVCLRVSIRIARSSRGRWGGAGNDLISS